ncbi:MAG TPA: GNAT family N-acetyltransferase [Pseudonocardiaceae bacterium]|nr:GNAT family N-acetyltransferase [Pseudonocardiaceae bacterium]
MTVFLTTDRLVLRRFTMHDADHLVELDSDPRVMRFLTGGKPTPRADIENRVLPAILRCYSLGPAGRWVVEDRATGAFLGWISLDPGENGDTEQVELGYRLRADTWGHGYATEGSRALVRAAFEYIGVGRVWAQTMAVNTASRRVMEKAGLRYVRTFHLHFDDPIDGTEQGEVEYELRKADWGAQPSSSCFCAR